MREKTRKAIQRGISKGGHTHKAIALLGGISLISVSTHISRMDDKYLTRYFENKRKARTRRFKESVREVNKLRRQGMSIDAACKALGCCDKTYYEGRRL